MRFRRIGRPEDPKLLKGVRQICAYCRVAPKTWYGWLREHGFPASRLPDGRYVTSMALIDDWVRSLSRQQAPNLGQRGDGGLSE